MKAEDPNIIEIEPALYARTLAQLELDGTRIVSIASPRRTYLVEIAAGPHQPSLALAPVAPRFGSGSHPAVKNST